MSRLEELIEKLCPEGVEYKTIADVCDISRGQVISKDYIRDNVGDYPVYSSQTENNGELGKISTYMFDGEYLTWTTDGANAGTVFYRNGKFSVTNVCGLLKVKTDDLITAFLYYALSIEAHKHVNSGMGNPKLMSNVMSRIKIPVPPLEVQSEIVRILNNFTELTAELTDKLTAELTARKKQYEHYRDELLTFGNDIPVFALNEIACYSKERIDAIEVDEGTYVGVDNLLQNRMGKTLSTHVPTEGRLVKYLKDDILIGNIRPYLKKIWYASNCGGTNGDVLVIRTTSNDVLPIYLYSVLCSDKFFDYNMQHSKGAKMPRGDKEAIMSFNVAVPSLEEQQRIVDILDRFDKLCNDISEGLPAEIEARQKQYEYYRDKLLTFKEKAI
ncbi:MAG: restriction endonuclease subunit S [Clostridia bacterium]|nr:restriction endonuclease subunit S [Clostridia bacterium]